MKRVELATRRAVGAARSEPVPGVTSERTEEFSPVALEHAVELPLDKIRRWRGQPRAWFDDQKLHELAESIRLRGYCNRSACGRTAGRTCPRAAT
jgi:hypothetical protein